jgi:hypothetical protein
MRLTPKMLNVARKRPWTCPNYGRYFWDKTLETRNNKVTEGVNNNNAEIDGFICGNCWPEIIITQNRRILRLSFP